MFAMLIRKIKLKLGFESKSFRVAKFHVEYTIAPFTRESALSGSVHESAILFFYEKILYLFKGRELVAWGLTIIFLKKQAQFMNVFFQA